MLTNHSAYNQESTRPTLTEVTAVGRKVVKYVVIGLVSYMILTTLIRSFVSYWRAVNPPPAPPPTVGFGQLPALDFPYQEAPAAPEQIEISIPQEKIAGWAELDRAQVLPVVEPRMSLLADDRVREIAQNFGFSGQPEMLTTKLYRWYKYEPLEFFFEIQLDDYNFSLQSDYRTRPELLGDDLPPEEQRAIRTVKNQLSRADLLPNDLADSTGEVRYLKSLAGQLVEAVSLSDANLIQVNIDRTPINDQYQCFAPQQNQSIVSAVLTNAIGRRELIVELDYNYHAIDRVAAETYPLKSIDQALTELEAGQAHIASEQTISDTIIRDVMLGYFDSHQYQPYLQPIWVFTGDNDFMAYVSAIDPSYID